ESYVMWVRVFFFQAEDGIRDATVTGVQTCALPIYAVGNQFAKFFLDEALLDEIFEDRDGQLEAGLDFASVGVHADEGVAIKGCRDILLDAVGAFLITDGDAQALSLKLNFFLKDELVQNVAGVE